MRRHRRGTLTFVGSAAVGSSVVGSSAPLSANYLASKAALHEFVRALAVALADSGVRSAAILPSTLDTPANRQAMPEADRRDWVTLDRAVEALAACAFHRTADGGPLYPVVGSR
jgi:NAD(P)-dependent dehydrogenase (short-subunit alcohol dehydrogenase family)